MTAEIYDLEKSQNLRLSGLDFCIVGAGAIGCYIAKVLSDRGAKVVLLEAGNRLTQSGKQIGFEAVNFGDRYGGLYEGRWFGLGGSTAHWGGALVPHSNFDLLAGHEDFETWTHVTSTVDECRLEVLRNLGYHAQSGFQVPSVLSAGVKTLLSEHGLVTEAALYLPFRRKNFKSLVRGRMAHGKVKLVLNAVATHWSITRTETGNAIRAVRCRTPSGCETTIEANRFIVAAGAIESTRILLELARECKGERTLDSSLSKTELGGGLGDHLSLPIGEITGTAASKLIKLFRPCFENSWMKSFRFLVPEQMEETGTRFFIHFIFNTETPGLHLAKAVLRDLQRSRIPRLKISELTAGASELFYLGMERFYRRRLYISEKTNVLVQLDCEQRRSQENLIALSSAEDIYGRQKINLNWRITPEDSKTFSHISQGVLQRIRKCLPEIKPLSDERIKDDSLVKPYDAYHPVGTCRMGTDPTSVIDFEFAVKSFRNLFTVSTAVLPTAGTANPTFSTLCLAHRLCQQLM
jgi:choline dehydrogenase-like flavoprotein